VDGKTNQITWLAAAGPAGFQGLAGGGASGSGLAIVPI
jgi:hypothetical protein